MSVRPCTICLKVSNSEIHPVRELHQGTFEVFHYAECPSCGFLELIDKPKDLGPYYSSGYYSHRSQNSLKAYLKSLRAAHAFGRHKFLGGLLHNVFGYPPIVRWIEPMKPQASWRILDIGCGEGIALQDLRRCGFSALDGIDPFLQADRHLGPVRLQKKALAEVNASYDLIIMNHSIEHMDNQIGVMNHLNRLLTPEGWLLIRMPIVGRGWKTFKGNWYGLDAPRHLVIHSQSSFAALVKESQFEIKFIEFDTDEHHYLASRQYEREISFQAKNSYVNGIAGSIFSEQDIAEAKAYALKANRDKCGDQASFYLQRKGV